MPTSAVYLPFHYQRSSCPSLLFIYLSTTNQARAHLCCLSTFPLQKKLVPTSAVYLPFHYKESSCPPLLFIYLLYISTVKKVLCSFTALTSLGENTDIWESHHGNYCLVKKVEYCIGHLHILHSFL